MKLTLLMAWGWRHHGLNGNKEGDADGYGWTKQRHYPARKCYSRHVFLAEKITTDDVSIQNPLGSVNYQYILAINFSVTSGTAGFFANPLANRDAAGNRMLTVDSNGIRVTEFYPWISFTADAITLRGSRNGGYNSGLYHVFAWGKIDN